MSAGFMVPTTSARAINGSSCERIRYWVKLGTSLHRTLNVNHDTTVPSTRLIGILASRSVGVTTRMQAPSAGSSIPDTPPGGTKKISNGWKTSRK